MTVTGPKRGLNCRINVHIVQMVRWVDGGVVVHNVSTRGAELVVTEGHFHNSKLLYQECLHFHPSASNLLLFKFLRCFVPFLFPSLSKNLVIL